MKRIALVVVLAGCYLDEEPPEPQAVRCDLTCEDIEARALELSGCESVEIQPTQGVEPNLYWLRCPDSCVPDEGQCEEPCIPGGGPCSQCLHAANSGLTLDEAATNHGDKPGVTCRWREGPEAGVCVVAGRITGTGCQGP